MLENGLIYQTVDGKRVVVVPNSVELKMLLLNEHHDATIAGHLSRDKTYASLAENFVWPDMSKDVADDVAQCPTCQATKATNQLKPGLLQPLDIPAKCWDHIHMDLIGPLPATPRGNTAILTVVDRLSKAAIFAGAKMTVTAGLAKLFFEQVFRHHGIPSVIISDRDPRFTSNF